MKELDYPTYPSTTGPRLEWSAVFAGTAISLAVLAGLMVLGVSIGFLAAPGAGDAQGLARGLGIGGSAYILASGIASFYLGGWFASRLSNAGRPADGVLYGLVSWSATTLVAAFLFTSALTGLMGSAMGVVGQAAQGVGQGAGGGIAQGGGDIGERLGSVGRQIRDQVQSVTGEGGGGQAQQAGAEQGGAGGGVPQEAETASQAAGAFGLFGFLLMLCEAIAAAIGGRVGARLYRPVPINQYHPRRSHHRAEVQH